MCVQASSGQREKVDEVDENNASEQDALYAYRDTHAYICTSMYI